MIRFGPLSEGEGLCAVEEVNGCEVDMFECCTVGEGNVDDDARAT